MTTDTQDAAPDGPRARIADALVRLMAAGRIDINHDAVAEEAGLSRRTVYRYYPDRESLLESAWDRVRAQAGRQIALPAREADLVDTIHDLHAGFEAMAPLIALIRSTPQGRAIRLAGNKQRVKAYTKAAADAVKDLPPQDRRLATAILQALHTSIWLELHDHWGLTGAQSARATRWAMRTLLDDLKSRNGRPLDTP